MNPHLVVLLEFLNSIGIASAIEPGAKGFVPMIRIEAGCLKVDPACPVSSALHEAGHLAIIPSAFRHKAGQDIGVVQKALLESLRFEKDVDSLAVRAALNCGDAEATAWAWAAGRHLGFPGEDIIASDEYGGDGESIRVMLAMGGYVGIHGLAHGGFCVTREGRLEEVFKLPAFPRLVRWLQV